ncbi:MAG: glycosyltransferase, partial [Candidatus Hydrothermae bacterium]|nr:glycosyltransferase [Candidatus Hydrothermae bacterium]
MKVSLLVPAYNERENVEPLLRSFARFIREQNLDWELVLVDDGSTDGTYEVAEKLKKRYPFLQLLR